MSSAIARFWCPDISIEMPRSSIRCTSEHAHCPLMWNDFPLLGSDVSPALRPPGKPVAGLTWAVLHLRKSPPRHSLAGTPGEVPTSEFSRDLLDQDDGIRTP